MGFIDDVVDFFTKKIEIDDNVKNAEDDFMKELNQMEQSYNERQKQAYIDKKMEGYAESPNYEKMKYDAPSDEEIEKMAKSEADKYYNDKYKEINESTEKNKKQLESSKNEYLTSAEESINAINQIYDASKKNIENDALKRGLGRSSIVGERLENLESEKSGQESEVYKALNQNLTDLNIKISELETQRDGALDELDIESAVVLNDKLNELKNERAKKTEEVTQFNNEIQEKINSYNSARNKALNQYLSEYADITVGKVNDEDYNKIKSDEYLNRYNAAYEFYRFYPTDMARQMIKDNTLLKSYLGESYYDTLLSKFKN